MPDNYFFKVQHTSTYNLHEVQMLKSKLSKPRYFLCLNVLDSDHLLRPPLLSRIRSSLILFNLVSGCCPLCGIRSHFLLTLVLVGLSSVRCIRSPFYLAKVAHFLCGTRSFRILFIPVLGSQPSVCNKVLCARQSAICVA